MLKSQNIYSLVNENKVKHNEDRQVILRMADLVVFTSSIIKYNRIHVDSS